MTARTARRSVRPAIDPLESRVLFATIVGLTSSDQLVTFDSATPGTASAPVNVTGLGASETLLGIDFRPATGQLFGLGSTGQLYIINPTSGAATTLGTPLTISGTNFGFDFNPSSGALRIVSDSDINLRIASATGAVAGTDTTLAYATGDANVGDNPNIVGAAYSNNTASTATTTLYGIDADNDVLVTQGSGPGVTPVVSPNTGQLFTVGALGADFTGVGGFDVAESDGVAYAAFVPQGGSASTFYTVNLTSGAATAATGAIGSNLTLKGLTALPPARTLFALASTGTAFARLNQANLTANPTLTNITGLATGDTISSIDFRPATGQLFGSTAGGQLYTINPATGAATALGTGLTPDLAGDIGDIDFNPTVDRLRVVTDADANARANPDTGALVDSNTTTDGVQVDTNLAYATGDAGAGADPNVIAAAYTNSVQGATATTLYAIDAARDFLISIGSIEGATTTVSPNTGQLFSVGTLGAGIDVTSGGLDIANAGAAFGLFNVAGTAATQLYTINTGTGAATLVGNVGDGTTTFTDVAVGNTVFTVTPATQNVAENAGNATITVNRGGVADGAAAVSFALVTPGAGVTAATAGTDFGTAGQTTFSGVTTFADGETSKTITVPLINDTTDEPDETFIVGISGPIGGTLGNTTQATVVITDDDDASTPGTGSVTVATDPIRTTGKVTQLLTVNGTDGDDVIIVNTVGSTIVVTLNGQPLGTPTTTKGLYRIAVYAGDGDDEVRINSKVKFSAEVHGEGGDDLLVGSKGRDLLVGGNGVDGLYGRAGEDILIGGISDYTENPTATATLLNTFLGKGNFATRANAVSTGTGINGFVFSSTTIDDDSDRDYLDGAGTADLILTHAGDAVADEANKGIVRAL